MADVKITDLVDQTTIDKIKELNTEMQQLLATYIGTARDLAKGLEIDVKVVGDIDKIEKILIDKSKDAAKANEKLNSVITEQGKVLAKTTPVMSRILMEQERVNKTQRDTYDQYDRVKQLLDRYHDTYENQLESLARLERELKNNKKQQSDNEKALESGKVTMTLYMERQKELIAEHRSLTQEKRLLTQIMTAEEKASKTNETSYVHMSQQLELLKKAYKDLSAESRESQLGKDLENAIQELDAHLKEVGADMGEFQRNVGNYAIAGQNGIVATESLNEAMNKQAVTMQDVSDQTKILEEAKRMLDTTDEKYSETLAAINEKIEENKARLADVSDIMEKDATTAAEAEMQNKRLKEAMRQIDITADDAQKRIDELNAKIEKNNEVIATATPTTDKLAQQEKDLAEEAKKASEEQKKLNDALKETKKTNEDLAGQMLSLIGINDSFASSLMSIKSEGDVWDGLGVKIKAFGKTLLGLLANPWVLTFLGIAGAATAVKWWYEYNKGLERASLLTKNFSGLVGDDMRDIRSKVQALAETMKEGFDETIGAANTLANQFGISWNETMEIMKEGVVLGANMHGNMIGNIEKYAGAFKDAGIAADEFMAILVNTKDGLFDEKAMKGITDAGMRIRNMSAKTQKALEDIGISGKKMQEDLEAGNITMVEAIQQVTDKLKELPPNAQEVGAAMVNVFGRKSALAGEEVIESISDINTSLGKMKAEMSAVQKINEEQIEAQAELNSTIAAMFDMTGGGFEEMTKSAKLYMTKGLLSIIEGIVDVINWFIRLYNQSMVIRGAANYITLAYKQMWEAVKFVLVQMIDSFKALGNIIEGVFTLDWDMVKDGYAKGLDALGKNLKDAAKNIAHNAAEAYNNTLSDEIKEINPKLKTTGAADNAAGSGVKTTHSAEGTGWDPNEEKNAKAAAKEAEKAAKEELKRLHELEESKISMMMEGHEKELALIRLKFKKKIDEIRGEGETEVALRVQLAIQCQKEISECETKYQKELSKINLENRLASVEKGSKEELDLRLAQIEQSKEAEVESAKKTGADISLIEEKYNYKRIELEEEYSRKLAEKVMERYGVEEITRNKAYSDEVNALKKKYAEELGLAKGNSDEQKKLKKKLDDDLYDLEVKYAQDATNATIKMLEDILAMEKLSDDERLEYEKKLAKAKIELEGQMADAAKKAAEEAADADDKLRDGRLKNIAEWLGHTQEAISNISDLVNALFDSQVSKLEEEEEANTAAGEKEQERIEKLVEKKVITEEEGEARKRAAEAKTAKKNEELEKKKAALLHKQAVYQKATDLAQAGIATALAITQALPNLILAGIAGTMGALQIATILATPIPQYAKGTDYHKGGPAIVGDGGRPEIVVFRGSAWLTPDTPTLVDIPEGSRVIPDAGAIDNSVLVELVTVNGRAPENQPVIVNNDYSKLQSEIRGVADLIRQQTKVQRRIALDNQYELFKSKI